MKEFLKGMLDIPSVAPIVAPLTAARPPALPAATPLTAPSIAVGTPCSCVRAALPPFFCAIT